MGKHGKDGPDDKLETQPMATIVPAPKPSNFVVPGTDRLAKDVRITDEGWNNIPENER